MKEVTEGMEEKERRAVDKGKEERKGTPTTEYKQKGMLEGTKKGKRRGWGVDHLYNCALRCNYARVSSILNLFIDPGISTISNNPPSPL